jgi:histidinol-phosphate aminotransferase
VRGQVAQERGLWLDWLAQRGLPHPAASASFVFFDAGRPQTEVAEALRAPGHRDRAGTCAFRPLGAHHDRAA